MTGAGDIENKRRGGANSDQRLDQPLTLGAIYDQGIAKGLETYAEIARLEIMLEEARENSDSEEVARLEKDIRFQREAMLPACITILRLANKARLAEVAANIRIKTIMMEADADLERLKRQLIFISSFTMNRTELLALIQEEYPDRDPQVVLAEMRIQALG